MHENIAVVDSHLELKLALQQKNICSPFMVIPGGKNFSPAVPLKDIAPNII